MLKRIIISLVCCLASVSVWGGEVSELAKSADKFFDALMSEESAGILSPQDLDQILIGKSLTLNLRAPQKAELFEETNWTNNSCRSDEGIIYQEVQLRQASAKAIKKCISAGNLKCTILDSKIINEVKCTAVAFASSGGIGKDVLNKLIKLSETIASLKEASHLLASSVKSLQGLLQAKLAMLIQAQSVKTNEILFLGQSKSGTTCKSTESSEYRVSQLRQSLNNAMAECHRAGYLKCEPVVGKGYKVQMYGYGFEGGMIVDEYICETFTFVTPTAD